MPRLLVQIATGPENPTRVALGLLLAKTALEAGHDVDVFFGGDGVSILRPETLAAGHGIGLGGFREHVDALVAGGARLFVSQMSSDARGLTVDAIGALAVTMVLPPQAVALVFEAERVVTY